ncbi:hypothetical protein I5Q34_07295 [Streptomyces sp. AV19]|nr:hypothetical protein [Streptomyces sp. AV19]
MSGRQIFYRMVGLYGYEKKERAYDRLTEHLNRARRAGLIRMEDIRDDRAVVIGPGAGYDGPADFWRSVAAAAEDYHCPLAEGQPRAAELWVESAGMMPMVARVAAGFGVTVYGSGGFESVGAKHEAACRIARRALPTTVLSLGDLDPSGWSIVDAAADDVATFVEEMDAEPPAVRRLAVTVEQVAAYGLETVPQKETDRRGERMPATVQAEALSPDQLTGIVRAGLAAVVDERALQAVRERSERERAELRAALDAYTAAHAMGDEADTV